MLIQEQKSHHSLKNTKQLLDTFQHPFIIKTLIRLGILGNFFSLDKHLRKTKPNWTKLSILVQTKFCSFVLLAIVDNSFLYKRAKLFLRDLESAISSWCPLPFFLLSCFLKVIIQFYGWKDIYWDILDFCFLLLKVTESFLELSLGGESTSYPLNKPIP